MGSETHVLDLPVIDFSNSELKPGTNEWNSLKSQVQKALEEIGCFKALFNKVPRELQRATFDALEELFDLPLETKTLNYSPKQSHGYIGQAPMVPLYESLGFERAHILEEAEKLTNILWPQGNPNFSKTIQAFSKQVSELDQLVKRMVMESLGLEKYKEEFLNSNYYLLRVMKYDGPKSAEKNIGMVPHKDPNTMTILHQNGINGMEIQTKTGEWIDVKVSPDSFIVMAGESLNAWTNGRVQPAPHRVMMTGSEARYSTGLFSIFKEGQMVQAPEEMVDEEHPLLYKPFDYGEFLDFRQRATKEVPRPDISLKAYCGL
ncbi:hypothetical protein Tsubulata_042121 [Turnera subulata]|uniref:Fe2OG dioxygenase domain-containing protein n=1 Tax=Turnera subulata TaxID=218843 RepID=A0A9Q0JAG0_9ROSI|nr:hypothetical protein Tsubulata_042121 [Turnera subulata]